MRRCAVRALAVIVATSAAALASHASAQVVDMTRGRLERCEMHRSLGRQLPPECGGTGERGDTPRGRVVIGGGQQPQTGAGAATPPPSGQTPPPRAVDRPPPSREKPYGAALPVPFDFDSDRLTPAGKQVVDQLAEVLKLNGQDKFIIQGHTDGVGGDDYNKTLSARRAQAVADYLVERHGIARDRLETQGLGKANPLLPADPRNARNRRVQILNVGG